MKKQILALLMLLIGMTAYGQTGVYQAAYFDTSGSYCVGVNDNAIGGTNFYPALTIEVWARQNALLSTIQTIVQTPEAYPSLRSPYNIYVQLDTLYVNYGVELVKCSYPFDTNWHHIAFVCDTTGHSIISYPYWTSYDSLTLYVDGVMQANSNAAHVDVTTSVSTNIHIGYYEADYSSSGTKFWNGNLCKLAWYDTVLYTGSFTPDCVFDTLGFYNGGNVSAPCILLVPMSEGGINTHLYGDHTYLASTTSVHYSYMTSPCAPIYTFYRSASHDTAIATNHNNSYMKGVHAATHINGWDNALGTTWVTCPYSNYGAFTDMLLVDTTIDSIYFYKDAYNHDTIKTDTVTIPLINQVPLINASQDGDVYPNPTNQSITIQSSLLINKIEVIDLSGQVLLSERPSKNVCHLDLGILNQGIYLLKVNDAYTKRVVKQ